MSKELKIAYEPHPVSPERKADLRTGGYKIIDAVFAPEGHTQPDGKPDARPVRGKKAEDPTGA